MTKSTKDKLMQLITTTFLKVNILIYSGMQSVIPSNSMQGVIADQYIDHKPERQKLSNKPIPPLNNIIDVLAMF